mgnify:CR=1 FL=1
MVDVRDVPANMFIDHLANYIKSHIPAVKPPEWAKYVKTGPHKERVPDNVDWWYYRAASILRKLYLGGKPVGVGTLTVVYGGLKYRGSAPPHFRRASASPIRHILRQLESAGLVTKVHGKGRALTPKGMALLHRIAHEVFQEAVKLIPELSKYS